MYKTLYSLSIAGIFFLAIGQSCSSLNDHSKLSADEFVAAIYDNPGTIIDVRTESEFSQEHLQASKNIDVLLEERFRQEIATLPHKQTYYIYCRSGNRSARALQIMQDAGFPEVYELKGGINELKSAGYPIAGL